ncbi:MAG: hypothetical protein S4CHLAM2_00840 [Chlamydiales bacterium]|nr:hypothetical protein [Chlamydiales bacterium]
MKSILIALLTLTSSIALGDTYLNPIGPTNLSREDKLWINDLVEQKIGQFNLADRSWVLNQIQQAQQQGSQVSPTQGRGYRRYDGQPLGQLDSGDATGIE